jgi:multisubunit Na+/H+ antiporter MnhF subunit
LGAIGVGCLLLGFVIPLLPTIAAFVLGCIGASQAQAERDDTALLLSRISWIGAVVLLAVGILAMLAVLAFIGTIGFAAVFEGLGPEHW